jgi:hypothetical protein
MSLSVKDQAMAKQLGSSRILNNRPAIVWARRLLSGCLVAAPVAVLIWFVLSYSVSVVQEDQWACVEVIRKIAQGSQGWLDILLIQHNQHMLGLPFLLMALLSKATCYSTRAEAIFGIIFPLISIVAWWQLTRKRSTSALPALLPIVALVCSLRQYESLLGGFLGGLEHIISPTLCLLTVCFLDSVEQVNFQFLAAMVSGFLCTLTLVNGLFVLPLGFMQLVASSVLKKLPRKNALALMLLWTGLCAVVGAIYLTHFRVIGGTSGFSLDYIRSHLQLVFQFLLAFLGSPVVPSDRSDLAVAAGLITTAILAVNVIAITRKPAAFENSMVAPLLLMLFVLGTDCFILIGRVQLGVSQALTSRYVSISYLWLAGLFLFLLAARKLPSAIRVPSLVAVLALMVAGVILAVNDGLVWGQVSRNYKLGLTNTLLNYKLQDEESLSRLLKEPYTGMVRQDAPFLETNGMNVFSKRMPSATWQPAVKPLSIIDAITMHADQYAGGQYIYTLDRSDQRYVSFNGWAADPNSKGPVGGVSVIVDHSLELPAAYGFDRAEIARVLKKSGYIRSGFNASCLSTFLPYGAHSISLKLLSPDGRSYYKTSAEALLLVYDSLGKFWSKAGDSVYCARSPQQIKRDLKLGGDSLFFNAGGSKIDCKGKGLQIVLPALPNGYARARALKLAITAPYACCAEIYYMTGQDRDYSWQRKVKLKLLPGKNTVYAMLPGTIRGSLRIDAGERPGLFEVESIDIREYSG